MESLGATKGTVATFGSFATAMGPLLLGALLKAGITFGVIVPAAGLLGLAAVGLSLLARAFLRNRPVGPLGNV